MSNTKIGLVYHLNNKINYFYRFSVIHQNTLLPIYFALKQNTPHQSFPRDLGQLKIVLKSICFYFQIISFFYMLIPTILSLLVLASSLNCPLSQNLRSSVFSGLLSVQPEPNKISQDMQYTNNFDITLPQIPQVCLSISGIDDANQGYMRIFLNQESVSQKSFIVRVKSPEKCVWNKLRTHYLVSTKKQIQIGSLTIYNPQYDNNGFISLKYQPSLRVTQQIKIRVFVAGIDIASQNGAPLSINHQKTFINSIVTFIFSSQLCNIYALTLSIIIFDPNTPGILFVDGVIEQSSLSTSTQVKVQKTQIQQLRINFIGFSSISAKDINGLSVSISFNDQFSLVIDSTDIKFIKVNYLVLAFVNCGSCSGYPYFYGDKCYTQCPQGTKMSLGRCIPIDCRNGYQINSINQCVPVCGPNSYFSGKYCSCQSGYNMIGGICNKCPSGTYFSYVQMRCINVCGTNANYNSSDGRCYCFTGYLLIDNQCSTCLAGTIYDPIQQKCLNQALNCGENQVIAFGKCICENTYYRINNRCQRCPEYSTFNSVVGYCQCNQGYKMNGNSCVSSCRENEILVGSDCQCRPGFSRSLFGVCNPISCSQYQYLSRDGMCICQTGYSRNNFGVCTPISISCPNNQVLIDGNCVCIPGYSLNPDGICYKIQCPPGQRLDNTFGRCIPICSSNTNWDARTQQCIPQCTGGYVYDSTFGSCIPNCQSGYKWNGSQCICSINCQSVCPPGSQYNIAYQACLPSQNCQINQIWNGVSCVCANGFYNIGGNCQKSCQPYAEYIGERCVCNQGYAEVNGLCVISQCPPASKWDQFSQKCISICNNNQIWNGGSCICPIGTYDLNGVCINVPICNINNNQVLINGRCQCSPGTFRINQICSRNCPPNTQWNPILRQCRTRTINCANEMIWDGVRCQCPPGTTLTISGRCLRSCGPNSMSAPNNQCICINGFTKNIYDQCVSSICQKGYSFVNGNCIVTSCGQGQQWSGNNCVCMENYERFSPNLCIRSCGKNQVRRGRNCQCIDGFQQNRRGQCRPVRQNCRSPHRRQRGVCICAQGYEKSPSGECIQICQAGYTRNNGICSRCPQNSQPIGNVCICRYNNQPVSPNDRCSQSSQPVGPSCLDPNSDWDRQSGVCKCRKTHFWIYGGCKNRRRCGRNQIWTGQDCVCQYGYIKRGNYCQRVNQQYYCPPNSNFNGVNCQCNDGYYPFNNAECIACTNNNYWNGQQCGNSGGNCLNGFVWDQRRRTCYFPNLSCQQNQYWDGVNCRCKQGFFWIQGRCVTCPLGAVYDGVQCTKGQVDTRCNDPYSYWNGQICVCIPGYWKLDAICVTCPENYEWNGICCRLQRGFNFARTDSVSRWNTVDVKFK